MPRAKELVYFPEQTSARKSYTERIVRLFTDYLASHGLRLTAQRRLILDYFLKTDRHLSQEDIYSALRRHGIGRATVFRTLKMMEECKLVDHVVGIAGKPRFEVNIERPHHDHLICVSCGRIQEVRWPKLEAIQEETCRKIGFIPNWHRHEIFGWCQACSKKKPAP